jgi:hypothetical protein
MNLKQLLSQQTNYNKTREIGHYWASDIASIVGGYTTPANFLTPKKIAYKGTQRILVGVAMEDMFTKILKEQHIKVDSQPKKIMELDGYTLTIKPDFVFPDFTLETKYSFSPVNGIPDKWIYQLECEYRAYEKPVLLGVFKIPFDIKFFPFYPSEERWEFIKKTLKDFDEQLKYGK